MQIDEPLWTSAELAAACGAISAQPWFADGVQIFSAEVRPGDLFIALKDGDYDGHEFVADALARGAAAALVSRDVAVSGLQEQRLAQVADTMAALRLMATHARDRIPGKRIAVTGSAGKTSVVHALRHALEGTASTHASVRSYNNHIGVPLSLARMPRNTQFGIFELGSSAPGQIAPGAALIRPDVAIVTTVGPAHTAAFETEADIAAEKASLFDALTPAGVAIVGLDNAHDRQLKARAEATGADVITVSVLGDADVHPVRLTEHPHCTCLSADIAGVPVTYKVGQPGREWVLNSLLVLSAVRVLEADLGEAALALAKLEAEPGRGRFHRLVMGNIRATLIDDSFNANPLSMRAALRRLSLVPLRIGGRRIAVLADMQELGQHADAMHMALSHDLAAAKIDLLVAFGDLTAKAGEAAGIETKRWPTPRLGAERLARLLRDGDVVMVKGSQVAGLGALVSDLVRFSDDHAQDSMMDGAQMMKLAE